MNFREIKKKQFAINLECSCVVSGLSSGVYKNFIPLIFPSYSYRFTKIQLQSRLTELTTRLNVCVFRALRENRNGAIKSSKLEWFHCQVLNILWRHFYGL